MKQKKEEKKLNQLSVEFDTLKEQDKAYILGVARALSFAGKKGKTNTRKKSK